LRSGAKSGDICAAGYQVCSRSGQYSVGNGQSQARVQNRTIGIYNVIKCKTMIKKIIYIVLLSSTTILSAQVNFEEIFKMQLFLNGRNSKNSVSKNYRYFSDVISFKIEPLKVENNLSGNIDSEYTFYKVNASEIKFPTDKSTVFDISCPSNGYFVLGINLKTGASYRLAGFEMNDFFSFFNDFKNNFTGINLKRLKVNNFIKNYKVENLDFNCLCMGLKNIDDIDSFKYPCLKKCEDLYKIN
jgi:hypothetical protein